MTKTSLGIYIHIPFCKSRCKYCDFLSFKPASPTVDNYITSLKKEISMCEDISDKYLVDSIYLGGGTPSFLDASYIGGLMEKLYEIFDVSETSENSIELNPESTTQDKLVSYKNNKINRLSIGAQSFVEKELKLLGRIHTKGQAKNAVDMAKDIGFDNISLDLMMAIPSQDLESFRYSLVEALNLGLKHISIYDLIIEQGSYFYGILKKGHDLGLASEEENEKMFSLAKDLTSQYGLNQYEISNYAIETYESRHNEKYWTNKNFLGLGLGASSKIDDKRFSNTTNLSSYVNSIENNKRPIEIVDSLDALDQINEFIFMGLRRNKGIDIRAMEDLFGINFKENYKKEIEKNSKLGLIDIRSGYFRLTDKGRMFANQVELDFYKI